jgi:hypothetical protein
MALLLRTLVLVVVLLEAGAGSAQSLSTRKRVRYDFDHYWDAVRRQDADAILDCMDPRMFELVPRERLADGLRRSAADTTVRVMTGMAQEVRVTGPFHAGKVDFAGVTFTYGMRMRLANEPGTDVRLKDAFLMEMLEKEYGEGNVVLDEADGTFEIQAGRRLVAVLNEGDQVWRFLDHGKDMEGVNASLIPAPMLARLFP